MPKATASQSLKQSPFKDKLGNEVKFKWSTKDSEPFEKFSKSPPGGFTRIGTQETTYLMCPKSTMDDARKAGVNMDNLKDIMKWMKNRKGGVTNVFKATADKDNKLVWVLDKKTTIDPEDYYCLPFEGLTKK